MQFNWLKAADKGILNLSIKAVYTISKEAIFISSL
jgi:hypothetical protein